jgi:hypothetical protein
MIEKECYVLATMLNDEVLYLTEKYGFDDDISIALKAKNIITARFIRNELELKHKCHLDIIPLKITYELKLEEWC